MRRAWLHGLLGLGAVVGTVGCAMAPGSPPKEPIRWIVVEKKAGELAEEGALGGAVLEPGAVLLVMEPVYGEDWRVTVKAHDHFVELVEVSPSGTAAPGETVTAKVRVAGGSPKNRYRLMATPTRQDVRVFDQSEHLVTAGVVVAFRFTSLTGGKSGIEVTVERLD